MPDDRPHRDRLGLNELFQTFEQFPDVDCDDFTAGTRAPMPKKPNRDDPVIALPEPGEDERGL